MCMRSFLSRRLLAHLTHSARVSLWDSAMSVVRRRAPCVVRRQTSLKNISSKTTVQNLMKIYQRHPCGGGHKQLFKLPWQPKEKNLNIFLKIFSSKTAGQILLKLYEKHQCDMGNKRYGTEFWFYNFSGCNGTIKKKNLRNYLKIFSSKTTGLILMKLY